VVVLLLQPEMHCRNQLLRQKYLFDADSKSFVSSDLLSWAADRPCSVQDLSWGYLLKVKRGKLARMAEHGLVGGKLRKLKFECHHIKGLLLCAEALQVLQVGGLHTKRGRSLSGTKCCMKFNHVKGSSFCRQSCACASNKESLIASSNYCRAVFACTHARTHAHMVTARPQSGGSILSIQLQQAVVVSIANEAALREITACPYLTFSWFAGWCRIVGRAFHCPLLLDGQSFLDMDPLFCLKDDGALCAR